jgi:hypothetical protein
MARRASSDSSRSTVAPTDGHQRSRGLAANARHTVVPYFCSKLSSRAMTSSIRCGRFASFITSTGSRSSPSSKLPLRTRPDAAPAPAQSRGERRGRETFRMPKPEASTLVSPSPRRYEPSASCTKASPTIRSPSREEFRSSPAALAAASLLALARTRAYLTILVISIVRLSPLGILDLTASYSAASRLIVSSSTARAALRYSAAIWPTCR